MSTSHREDLSQVKRLLLEKLARGEFQPKSRRQEVGSVEGAEELASLSQEQVWLHAQENATIPQLYNESITIYRNGPIDVSVLKASLREVLRRHEAWRSTFELKAGKLRQVVHEDGWEFPLSVLDLRELPEAERLLEAPRAGDSQAQQPFDLSRGPLVRALLVSLSEQQHRLYIDMHQIIADGISVYEVLPTELATLYEGFVANDPAHLRDLPQQFKNYSAWQRKSLEQGARQKQLEYWRERFRDGVPAYLDWPLDRPRPTIETHRGAVQPFSIPLESLEAVQEVRRGAQVPLFAALVAALGVLLHTYTNQSDIVLGTLAPCGRHRAEFQKLLGYFMNPVALRLHVRGSDSFADLIRQAHEVIVGAISHGDIPFEEVVKELSVRPDPTRHPLFQIAISLAPARAPLPQGWDMTPTDVESGGARWDMYLELSERVEYLLGRAQYNPDLFECSTISSFLNDFRRILEAAGRNPHQPISLLLTEQGG